MDLKPIVDAGDKLREAIVATADACCPDVIGKDTTWAARRNSAVLMAEDALNLAIAIMMQEAQR